MVIHNLLPGKFYKLPHFIMQPTSTRLGVIKPLRFNLHVDANEQLAYKGSCEKSFYKRESACSLALLSYMHKLNRVSLVRCQYITDKSLRFLSKLPHLRYLSLNRCYDISDEGIKHICRIALQSLFLDCTSISNNALEYIKEIDSLQYLSLHYCDVDKKGLQHLHSMSLKYLSLEDCSLTNEDLQPLSSLSNLEYLNLEGNNNLSEKAMHYIKDLPLKSLILRQAYVDEKSAEILSNMSTLEEVVVWGKGAIRHLHRLPNLKSINLFGYEELLKYLPNFSHVETLYLNTRDTTDDALAKLKDFSNLQELILDSAIDITDEGVGRLGGLTTLTKLSLFALVYVTDATIDTLCNLKNLEHLNLAFTKISDDGLQKLSCLKKIKYLSLRGCSNVKNKDFAHVKSMFPLLEELNLCCRHCTEGPGFWLKEEI
ncbi:hypothetical protein [Candidatus Uabimicrobium sp. HlEnr_7]|uniref:hypothetical protein n=1 Tax=Candidatus Uabimicrobium helgolandensis TaxID=3095367 RepID=UPI003555CA67